MPSTQCGSSPITPEEEVRVYKGRLKLVLELAAEIRKQLREAQQRARKEKRP